MKKRFDQMSARRAPRPRASAPAVDALLLLLFLFLLLTPLPSLAPAAAQTVAARGIGIDIRGDDGSRVRLYDKSYALVVGVSDYTNGWRDLPGVRRDVAAVRAALEGHGFQVVVVEDADSARLEKAYADFIRQYGMGERNQNRLLFYFAGHGHTQRQSYGEEMGYIVPSDAPAPARDLDGFLSKAMDMQQMERYAKRIQSKHALFLFDSCFSGSLFAATRGVPDLINYKTARPVRQFITSGSADESVPDRSIFREQFVSALEGEADANRDGYVTGTELGEFLQDRVINYSRNAQHPQYGKIRNPNLDKGDFVFALAKATAAPPVAANAATPGKPAAPTPDAATTIEQGYWDAIKDSDDANDFKAYLRKYPNGRFAADAKLRISQAQAAAPAKTHGQPPAALSSRPPRSPEKSGKIVLLHYKNFDRPFWEALLPKFAGGGVSLTTTSRDDYSLVLRQLREVESGNKTAAKKFPYGVAIRGTFEYEEFDPYDGIYAKDVVVTLTAVDGDTGQTLAQEIIVKVRGFGITDGKADADAVTKAAAHVSAKFIEQVIAAAR